MNTFFESRWRVPLPWFVLCLTLLMASYILQVPLGFSDSKLVVRVAAALAFLCASWKILHPNKAVVFEPGRIQIRGVRPGWWKLFQRRTSVLIDDKDILDIRIGRIRDHSLLGMKLPPLGEPSRASSLQNFLWIRYQSGRGQSEIYYPDIYDIRNAKVLVSELKGRFGEKVNVFD